MRLVVVGPIVKTHITSSLIVPIMQLRYTLFHNLSWLPNDCVIDLKLLTIGNPILSNEQNELIFKHVFEYIKRPERFLV